MNFTGNYISKWFEKSRWYRDIVVQKHNGIKEIASHFLLVKGSIGIYFATISSFTKFKNELIIGC